LKLATYLKDGGAPKVGHVEGGEIRSLGGPSTLECNEHERNTVRRHGEEVRMKGLGRLVNPARIDGGYDS
jgi:hypothetical protein